MSDSGLPALRAAFLEESFGTADLVLHPVPSEFRHVDVRVYGPASTGCAYTTLVTDGLSDLLLERPYPGSSWACERVELVMYLEDPKLVPFQTEMPWEVELFRKVARLPLFTDLRPEAFLALPNFIPPRPFVRGSSLTHSVLLPPLAEPPEVREGFDAPDGTSVELLWFDLATTAEVDLLAERGPAAYLALLEAKRHGPPLRLRRRCHVGSRPGPPTDPAPNRIRRLEVGAFAADHGEVVSLSVALDIEDPASAEPFVAALIGKVAVQRMVSPPETQVMIVSIIGDLDARVFAELWRKHLPASAALSYFMSRMAKADVMQGTPAGVKLSECSLLAVL